MLKGKSVVLGVSGGIAAFKSASLASLLVKNHAEVTTIMTKNAGQFICPATFDAITGTRTITDTFDRNHEFSTEHISLSDKADIFIVAPATANVIAKLAGGIADDMLSTTALACNCPKLIAPGMNTKMWTNEITQRNITSLKNYGFYMIGPNYGRLACKTTGTGRMAEPDEIFEAITDILTSPKDMKGLSVLVTAGPTVEQIDPVRFITNRSTGKMGYAIAAAARSRGGSVTLISGPTSLAPVSNVENIKVTSAKDMLNEVTRRFYDFDIVIMAAAVADFTPKHFSDEKIKKTSDSLSLPLVRTDDILKTIGKRKKSHQLLCGFAMETNNLIERAKEKLEAKNLDMIVANSIAESGAGFGGDSNIITIITKDTVKPLPIMSKSECAHEILNSIMEDFNRKK